MSTDHRHRPARAGRLPSPSAVLAVCAHPDDESFGLGAVLAALTGAGTVCGVLCFTHGEASTLGPPVEDLGRVRAGELDAAAGALGVRRTHLLDYPDGALAAVPLPELATHVQRQVQQTDAQALLVFDEGGITGHPDHRQATAAAKEAAERLGLPVLVWTIPDHVAEVLNAEFGAGFVGCPQQQIDLTITVDRDAQHAAIACHATQSTDNPVLRRRLELLGDTEHLRHLRPKGWRASPDTQSDRAATSAAPDTKLPGQRRPTRMDFAAQSDPRSPRRASRE